MSVMSRSLKGIVVALTLGVGLVPLSPSSPGRPGDPLPATPAVELAAPAPLEPAAGSGKVGAQAPAPKLGSVARDQRPLMPSTKELVYRSDFPSLPFGRQNATRPVLDMRDPSMREVWLAYNFNASDIPTHQCRVSVREGMTPQQYQAASNTYVQCLVDAWRPWFAANKVLAPRVTVKSCAVSTDAECNGMPDNAIAWATVQGTRGTIYLQEYMHGWLTDAAQLESVLAHETVHELQFFVQDGAPSQGWSALYAGMAETDTAGARITRRTEIQAQCLGSAMVARSRGLTYQQLVDHGMVFPGDEIHWSYKSAEYWGKQAAKATKVGQCNAPIADNSLLTYP